MTKIEVQLQGEQSIGGVKMETKLIVFMSPATPPETAQAEYVLATRLAGAISKNLPIWIENTGGTNITMGGG